MDSDQIYETFGLNTLLIASILSIFTFSNAFAVDTRLRCGKRADQSRISVNIRNVTPGDYRVVVKSGNFMATTDLLPSIGDEVTADFNSEPAKDNDTIAIDANFISNGMVSASLINATGRIVVTTTASCKVR